MTHQHLADGLQQPGGLLIGQADRSQLSQGAQAGRLGDHRLVKKVHRQQSLLLASHHPADPLPGPGLPALGLGEHAVEVHSLLVGSPLEGGLGILLDLGTELRIQSQSLAEGLHGLLLATLTLQHSSQVETRVGRVGGRAHRGPTGVAGGIVILGPGGDRGQALEVVRLVGLDLAGPAEGIHGLLELAHGLEHQAQVVGRVIGSRIDPQCIGVILAGALQVVFLLVGLGQAEENLGVVGAKLQPLLQGAHGSLEIAQLQG